ncbi:hypothetical protein [Natrinema gelatinilyticum]|uniref:hypothetical protein n=1 Tax=Natrinema gelatinilyticum TaxID=2961571 RepID=UPI0020C1CB0A|nr:hypothetical protein [Natrinema gelatinilyticum]
MRPAGAFGPADRVGLALGEDERRILFSLDRGRFEALPVAGLAAESDVRRGFELVAAVPAVVAVPVAVAT